MLLICVLEIYVFRNNLFVFQVDPELCKLVDEGVEVHKVLLNKYLAYISVGKAQVDRAIRKLNTKVTENNAEQKYLGMSNHFCHITIVLTFF